MSNDATTSGREGWAWTLRWPPGGDGGWLKFAPDQLWQPVNPGWSFGNVTVNHGNSSAPEVEQAVLARYSYGRQIGRLMDAVEALVDALPPAQQEQPALRRFKQLAQEVCELKKENRAQRLRRLRAELAELRSSDPEGWIALMRER
ncbi:hypothetical protein [Azohydromonas aeria]|uniref:hypothetical protein n=1 Tax=Azohydromonas aeria TaxID=2590212 RepID=UPI0012FCE4A8|nr:hypothetical protein [Azohydromonas aeria]